MFALLNAFSFLIVKIIFGEGFEPVAPLLSILSFGLFFCFLWGDDWWTDYVEFRYG